MEKLKEEKNEEKKEEKSSKTTKKSKISPSLIITNVIIAGILVGFYYYDFEEQRVEIQGSKIGKSESYGKPLVGGNYF